MAAIVLVHGAWHGGWCWGKVTPLLRASGHAVYTPTLTGLGERSHLAQPEVNLETHVQDVLNVIECEELSEVILVGHSYGGIVIGAAATHLPERVTGTIYVDALLPIDGRSCWDSYHDLGAGEYVAPAEEWAKQSSNNWLLQPPESSFGVTAPDDAAWIRRRLTAQPVATFTQPVRLASPFDDLTPRLFIYCTPVQPGAVAKFAEQVRNDPTWSYREIEACHDVMISEPRALVDCFNDLIA